MRGLTIQVCNIMRDLVSEMKGNAFLAAGVSNKPSDATHRELSNPGVYDKNNPITAAPYAHTNSSWPSCGFVSRTINVCADFIEIHGCVV